MTIEPHPYYTQKARRTRKLLSRYFWLATGAMVTAAIVMITPHSCPAPAPAPEKPAAVKVTQIHKGAK